MVVAAFVAPYLLPATARFALAAAELPEVRLALITCGELELLPLPLRQRLAGHWRVQDALDPTQLAAAVRGLEQQVGRVERLFGPLEQLQVPLAQVREGLGIPGMTVRTARNVRDKSLMKETLTAAGVPCARHALVGSRAEAVAFVAAVGLPVVAKPPAGAGAQATYRLDDEPTFEHWLRSTRSGPMLLEEFLTGSEHSYDSVSVGGQVVWRSISDYLPPPLEVLREPWIQWTVLLPRHVDGPEYAGIHEWGPKALRALGVDEALTHLEWFRRPDGSIAVSEVAARPPGAQLTSMHGYSHDFDLYRAWARLMVTGKFEVPERRHAAGTAYLRGVGRGVVRAVHGVAEVQREVGHLVVDARLPEPGETATATDYTGQGHVTVRHEETEVVRQALRRIVSGIRVELMDSQ